MKNYLFIIPAVTIILFSCEKNSNENQNFEGITHTNMFGDVIGEADTSDWSNDKEWSDTELKLFNIDSSLNLNGTVEADIDIFPGCPNPVGSLLGFKFKNSKIPLGFKMVIVDNNFNVHYSTSNIITDKNNNYTIDVSGSNFSGGQIYRLYYGFYSQDKSLFYKGHGDFQVTRE